ncbi:hypothetical protein BURK2_00633 [Burkholderiales bacterium]|nr:hypothetical protein BURK2_00633 [Burkholderiales bacterium]
MPETSPRSLCAAALLLPGLAASLVQAQSPPERASLSLRLADYRDWQAGAERMSAQSPAFRLLTALGEATAFEANLMHDAVSGASPLYHDTLSGASGKGVNDHRTAGDVKFTRYFGNDALALGLAASSERDYRSRAASAEWRHWSQDRNTTITLGLGGSDDRIDPVNGLARGSQRHSSEVLLGLTQVLSPQSLLQANLVLGRGEGYFSDPYKPLDKRPQTREHQVLQVRYHHYLRPWDASLRLAWRYYRDTWSIHAHSLEAAWHQPLGKGWWVMPGLRYYTQSAAWFYHDPPFPSGWQLGAIYSGDTRLAAFGALAPSLSLGRDWGGGWRSDLRFEAYRQEARWRPGSGSEGFKGLRARMFSWGLSREF